MMDRLTIPYQPDALYDFSLNRLNREYISRHGLPASNPRTYVKLLQDRALPPKWHDKAAANIGAKAISLDLGHVVVGTRLTEVTQLLRVMSSLVAPRIVSRVATDASRRQAKRIGKRISHSIELVPPVAQ